MLLPHQAERHDPPRTDLELGTDGLVGESNLPSPPRPCVCISTASTIVVATDGGAVGSERRHAVAHDGDVGGGAADVGDHGISGVGEMGRTDEAGGRTERIVSTGRSFTKSTDTSEPLPRTIIIGASIPRSARLPPVVATRSSIMAMRRALSRAVTPRFGPPRLADSTWLQVTGFPVRSRMSSRAASSCSALRVANGR